MKLNLGCGTAWEYGQDWINIYNDKLIPPEGVVFLRYDMVAIKDIVATKMVDHIKMHRSLETLWKPDGKEFLVTCAKLLKHDGTMEILTRDIAMMRNASANLPADKLFDLWYGSRAKRWDRIAAAWEACEITVLLKTCGLIQVSSVAVDNISVLLTYKKP